ncbi:asparagine synthase-related protein [Nocardia mexicana]|uniref:asparagine synthase (glutamine-hydrolyzing) n=1 Tax=Nocardia mexicana TaxID=279262 RepID=A0A370HAC0_9NOCA|nr:asparagine synthase-related protein [Nocardia mexicana]RDI53180.1 asparagine synthase (glutamine-hydrolysing) [Nocardia mexicana]
MSSWFVALADSEGAGNVAARVRAEYSDVREVSHPSGRPWILGNWTDSEITVTRTGEGVFAAIGEHALQPNRLAGVGTGLFHRGSRRIESPTGSFHLIGARRGCVRVRGTASGVRRVFHSVVDGVTVASDRADVIATLAGKEVDQRQLALLLLYVVPWPLSFRSVWSGIEVVWPGYEVEFDRHGRVEHHRWWNPPPAELSLAQGAELLRSRLVDAVDLRVGDKDTVVCDLGGVDSTALCCLAARSSARVVAVTAASPDDLDDDVRWARETVDALGTVAHIIVDPDDMPMTYDGILDISDRFDEPCIVQVNKSKLEAVCHRNVESGAQVRLSGIGGDEILRVSWGWLHSTVRTHPLSTIGTARRWAAKHRYPLWRVGLQMADNQSYERHLKKVANAISSVPPRTPDPAITWGLGIISPPWLTGDASEMAREAVIDCSRNAAPVSRDRGLHQALEQLYGAARGARLCQQFARRIGVPIAAPYLDDAVIDAALSVRAVDRVDTRRYKPLLAEAMTGIVPESTLHRGTKANTSAAVARGLRQHRDDILAMMDNSRLAELGIIDPAVFRQMCEQPLLIERHRTSLDLTIAVEAWLQTEKRWATRPGLSRESVPS